MLAVHRRFLLLDQGLYSVISNMLINGAIAWAINRKIAVFPFNGEPGVVVNTLAISFLLPLLVCWIVTPLVTGKVRKGKLPGLGAPQFAPAGVACRPTWLRGVILGGAGMLLIGVPILAIWAALGPSEIGLTAYVTYTAVIAGVLAAFATPITAWWALQRAAPVSAAK